MLLQRARCSCIRLAGAGLLVGGVSCGFEYEPLFDETISASALEEISLPPSAEALVCARARSDAGLRTLLVLSYSGGRIEGLDVGALLGRPDQDCIGIASVATYDQLQALLENASSGALRRYALTDLMLPAELGGHHIAVGTNYPDHADRVGSEERFLFPKIVDPTGWTSEVELGQRLVDYEGEVAFVALEPWAEGQGPGRAGLILANDYTDRETLLVSIDPDDLESGKGFTTGKSFPGYLPVGNLLVIPRDPRAFAEKLTLNLYVNRALRQRERYARSIWDLPEIVRQIWARRDLRWDHAGRSVGLLAQPGPLPARTLILTGTPDGTVFSGLNVEQRASGFAEVLFGDYGHSIPDGAIEDYIRDARAAGVYLQPNDVVEMHVDYLGAMKNLMVIR